MTLPVRAAAVEIDDFAAERRAAPRKVVAVPDPNCCGSVEAFPSPVVAAVASSDADDHGALRAPAPKLERW